jgi:hypothetical protein
MAFLTELPLRFNPVKPSKVGSGVYPTVGIHPATRHAHRQPCLQPAHAQPSAVPDVLGALNHAAKIEGLEMLGPLAHRLCLRNTFSLLLDVVVIILQGLFPLI